MVSQLIFTSSSLHGSPTVIINYIRDLLPSESEADMPDIT